MSTWSKLSKTEQDAGRRLAERAWKAGVDVTVTRAATHYKDVHAEVVAAEETTKPATPETKTRVLTVHLSAPEQATHAITQDWNHPTGWLEEHNITCRPLDDLLRGVTSHDSITDGPVETPGDQWTLAPDTASDITEWLAANRDDECWFTVISLADLPDGTYPALVREVNWLLVRVEETPTPTYLYRNLTRHAVTVYPEHTPELIVPGEHQPVLDLPPGESDARVEETVTPAGHLGQVPFAVLSFGAMSNLPAPTPGVTLIVSRLTAITLHAAGEHRPDVAFPAGQVRALVDGVQRVIGCRSLARLA